MWIEISKVMLIFTNKNGFFTRPKIVPTPGEDP